MNEEQINKIKNEVAKTYPVEKQNLILMKILIEIQKAMKEIEVKAGMEFTSVNMDVINEGMAMFQYLSEKNAIIETEADD